MGLNLNKNTNQNDVLQTVNNNQNSLEDEIDLFELWDGLVQEKVTILLSFCAAVIIAVIYVFSVTPVYKASSYLLPPLPEKVLPMNVLAQSLGSEGEVEGWNVAFNSSASVFKIFYATLGSRQTLKIIFDEYDLVSLYNPEIKKLTGADNLKAKRAAFDNFTNDFTIHLIDKNNLSLGVIVHLSLALSDAQVAEILNALVKVAEQGAINQLFKQITVERTARLSLFQQRIESARKVEQDRRLDRLALLNESIAITKSLGISKPITAGPSLNVNNANVNTGQTFALYLLGSDLLEAEKKVLELRKNDDAFIDGLRDWQEELRKLNALKIELKKFAVVDINQSALLADKVKPNKVLTLAVAGVLGLMLGVFIALIRRAVNKRRLVT